VDDIYKDTDEVWQKLASGNHLEAVEDARKRHIVGPVVSLTVMLWVVAIMASYWVDVN
jgi:hypothetical protein